jgi:hypothetical protein
MPKKKLEGALTQKEKEFLFNRFFTVKEITAIDTAVTPDGKSLQQVNIKTKAWKAVITRRVNAANKLKKQGFDDNQIRIMYNRKSKMKGAPTPFDFLKAEYEDAEKTKDYKTMRKKIKDKIKQFYGQDYFKNVAIKNPKYKPVVRPYIPKVRRIVK